MGNLLFSFHRLSLHILLLITNKAFQINNTIMKVVQVGHVAVTVLINPIVILDIINNNKIITL